MSSRRPEARDDLTPLLAPRSIAVVGASESPDSWAPEIERSLRHVGYDGELYPVNPKYDSVWGRPCLHSIEELPRGVDLVVFVVPARVVVRMIDDCGARGVRGIMVVSSGFAEAGEEGVALQAQLREAAIRTGIPVLGPNVEGFVNYVERVAPYGTTPPPEPRAGSISVISQSGTVAWAMNQLASDRGVGLRIILGVGNEAVLGLGDLFEWAAGDPKTKVVTSYIETMRDVDRIGRGLDALRRAGKPVLICAPEGRSEAARRSIVAHTGALAGNTTLRDAWLRAQGVILIEDPVTMFEAAVLLSKVRKLRTTGVAAALQSGGACTLFAEAAGATGLDLPEFSTATKRTLRKVLPHFASQNNPLDVTGQAAVETDMYEGALEALANDPAIGLIAFDAFPPRLEGETPWADPVLATVKELQRATGVAFASVAMSPLAYIPSAKAFTRTHTLPFLQGHHAAAGAIRALVEFQGSKGRSTADDMPAHANRAKALRVLKGREGPIDEETGARILRLYGVARPKERSLSTPEQAATFARSIGFPVVVKAQAPEIPHKAKLGGVRLGLRNATDVEVAAAEVLEAAKRAGAKAPKVLVQQMVRGAEVLVGAVVDERFGPMITVRPGGALAEEGDAVFVPCPLRPGQAKRFLVEQAPLCGLDPDLHDLAAAAKAVAAIARITHDLRDRLASFEANPLLVGERGAVAVDALAEVRRG
ncbi:MAG: acetate--CoA ligase family protein [Actinomycetota bacterium]|nr:acetate--CoA ligase family protein [Actinomycetota bacterium]MDH5223278.1 acetate--CoA ligase family protein [Actinomycetota bacterium]MDH5313482.1 acetate--CoA ligase family protein [Actinomycetota bacterium]